MNLGKESETLEFKKTTGELIERIGSDKSGYWEIKNQ